MNDACKANFKVRYTQLIKETLNKRIKIAIFKLKRRKQPRKLAKERKKRKDGGENETVKRTGVKKNNAESMVKCWNTKLIV